MARMTRRGLHVTNPDVRGCCSAPPSTIVTVAQRRDDGGREWFRTVWGYPLSETDRVIDTVTALKVLLNGRPGVVL
jgi:hypothetical protein